jgi:sulfur-oxidizing protein SoxA
LAVYIAAHCFGAATTEILLAERRSSCNLMSSKTKAMQDEDTSNPAMLWVLEGEALWSQKAGVANRACTDCHGNAATSMKSVASRNPAFDKKRKVPLDLEGRINICRSERQ